MSNRIYSTWSYSSKFTAWRHGAGLWPSAKDAGVKLTPPPPLSFNQTHSWSRHYVLRPGMATMIHWSRAALHSRTWTCGGGWTRSRRLTSVNWLRTRRVSRGRRNWCRSYRPRYVGLLLICISVAALRGTQVLNSSPATSGTAVQEEMRGSGADDAGEDLRVGQTAIECEWLWQ